MKRLIALALVFSVLLAHADTNIVKREHRKLTEAERAARRAEMAAKRAARIAADGGWVVKPSKDNVARVVSAQGRVPLDVIEKFVAQFNTGLRMYIEVSQIASSADVWQTLRNAQNMPRTGAVMLVVDDESLPRILCAMEEGWSILNVRDLDSDMPPKDVYEKRIGKEINRAFAQAFGAGISYNRPCVMVPAFSLRDIDAIEFPVISPEAMSKMEEVGNKRHIDRMIRTTYKIACREGWAAAPTNEVQRKVWKEVHDLPTNPIKIEFDPKTDRK